MKRGESGKRDDEAARSQYPCEQELGNAHSEGCKERECSEQLSYQLQTWPPGPTEYEKWRSIPAYAQPSLHRMADGLANWMDRIQSRWKWSLSRWWQLMRSEFCRLVSILEKLEAENE